MQYAGASLGGIWFLLQGFLLLGLYIFISDRFISRGTDISHVLTGILFWIPFSEMLQKSTVVLTENRAIIKRSAIGLELFYWIPMVQMVFHYLLLAIPAFFYLKWIGKLSFHSYLLVPYLVIFSIILFPLSRYLSMANVLLKDISPIVRLFLQILFWALPIVYITPDYIHTYLIYNPLYPCLEIFRMILLSAYETNNLYFIVNLLIFNLMIYIITNFKLKKQIADHI